MKQDWKEFITSTLVNGTQYTGNKTAGIKQFSGSMVGNTVLQNYLKFVNGSAEKSTFEATTFGSIFHVGAETIFSNLKDDEIRVEISLKVPLSNGWIISGTMDLVLDKYKMIVDWKTTTATTIKKVRSEGKNNGYALQQAVYKWLFWKEFGIEYGCALGMVDKGHSYYKDNKNQMLELIEIETHSLEDIEAILYEKTNELDEYIDLGQEPDECSMNEKWPYARKGQKAKMMKCIHYCDQNVNCKHYSPYSAKNNLLGLDL